jgi:hypothetical protein
MTKVIKISINHKRDLYPSIRNSKNPKLKEHYKLHCKLLSKVIKEAKILQYNKQISTSYNKTRPTWNIVKFKTGRKKREGGGGGGGGKKKKKKTQNKKLLYIFLFFFF